MIEDKIGLFFDELKNRGIEISGETAFICKDGAVMIVPNDRGAVDIMIVRNPIHIDYELGITGQDVELWKTTEEVVQEYCEKPQTNADRINAMTPEEKAEWIYKHDSKVLELGRWSKERILEYMLAKLERGVDDGGNR
jgi:hypothetical protein